MLEMLSVRVALLLLIDSKVDFVALDFLTKTANFLFSTKMVAIIVSRPCSLTRSIISENMVLYTVMYVFI